MRLKKNNSEQKLRGAYYTPLPLAKAMVQLFANSNTKKILEPSCGDGVFIDCLAEVNSFKHISSLTAVEIDTNEADKVRKKYISENEIQVLNTDFFEFYASNYKKKQYDLIIGNPPYIRYQYLTKNQREIQSKILISHGMKSNKLINAWVCFLVSCTQMLADNGTIAFVVPAEILQVGYAEDLRLFLSLQFSHITLITFEKLVFPEIEQEVVVFIGKKGGDEKGIRIIEMNDLKGFATLDLKQNGYQKLQHVKEKWIKYFISEKDAQVLHAIRNDKRFIKFEEYGLINVGITTGNNDYFSIDAKTEDTFKLSSVTLPLIGRSSHAHGIYFTDNDWKANIDKSKKAMLISFPKTSYDQYPLEHKAYIEQGEMNNQHLGYKCSIRDHWYIVPSIWVPDAFFLRRSNRFPKFVLNQCGAVSTDTMHRIKFKAGVHAGHVLLSYYNSISFAFTEICGRSYGGGVLEVLPGEMGNIMLPKIVSLNPVLEQDLLNFIDNTIRNKRNIELVLDKIDQELLVNILGIDADLCMQCRNIWKILQNRRLKRA